MPDRDTVIAMAAKADFFKDGFDQWVAPNEGSLLRFAALVAAQEREQCALVCDDMPTPPSCNVLERSLWDVATVACADSIRARKEEM